MEDPEGSGKELTPHGGGSLDSLATQASFKTKNASASMRATGWWAALAVSVACLVWVLLFHHPEPGDNSQTVAALFGFIAGLALMAVIRKDELTRALTEKDRYMEEVMRMAERQAKLEAEFLRARLSSLPPPAVPPAASAKASPKPPKRAKGGKS